MTSVSSVPARAVSSVPAGSVSSVAAPPFALFQPSSVSMGAYSVNLWSQNAPILRK